MELVDSDSLQQALDEAEGDGRCVGACCPYLHKPNAYDDPTQMFVLVTSPSAYDGRELCRF